MTTIVRQSALAPTSEVLGALPRQFVRFAAVGVANTGLFLVIYMLFRTVTTVTVANLVAALLTTVAGTCLNGKVTFRVSGLVTVRQHMKSMAVTVLGMVITTVAANMAGGSETRELVALVVASGVAGAARFVLLRHWVFCSDQSAGGCGSARSSAATRPLPLGQLHIGQLGHDSHHDRVAPIGSRYFIPR